MTRPAIDWEAVEREYRAGVRSLADIGTEFGVSAPGILKRAKKDGWVRDLSAKIKAKADAKVNESLVNDSVNAKTAVSIGKEHKQIHRDIRVMLVNLGYSSAEFSAVYKDQQLID